LAIIAGFAGIDRFVRDHSRFGLPPPFPGEVRLLGKARRFLRARSTAV
jgi:hypothetical protein